MGESSSDSPFFRHFERSPNHKELNMNILHAVGCALALTIASCAAIPIGALCSSVGFTGVAALAGAVAVIAVIQ